MATSKKVKNKILDVIENKRLIPRYASLTIALFLSAIGFNLFLNPFGLVAGGTGGVATILHQLYGLNPSTIILAISIILTALSLIFLDWDYSISMIFITIVYPIFVQFTSGISKIVVLNTTDMFLIAIFGGVVSGITSGIVYKNGLSSGGFNVISQILYEKFKISISLTGLIINGIIVIIGGIITNFDMVLYALIYLYISKIVTDRIMLGVSKEKAFYIVTDYPKEISDKVINELNHSVTIFDTRGGKEKQKKKTVMAVVPTKSYYIFKDMIERIDPKAFMVVVDSYEVKGGK